MIQDEFFFYPASDCDDRAILFAYISGVRLHNKTIGLNYTEHVADAVLILNKKGDYVIYKDEAYFVCDLTYIGADIGESMPKFKKLSAAIIVP